MKAGVYARFANFHQVRLGERNQACRDSAKLSRLLEYLAEAVELDRRAKIRRGIAIAREKRNKMQPNKFARGEEVQS